MKKKTIKQLEILATKLPTSIIEVSVREKVTGKKALELGYKPIKGEDIKPDEHYMITVTRLKPLDHAKKLKLYLTKYRDRFMEEYSKWFNPHHARMIKKYPEKFKKKISEEVMNELKKEE